MQTFTIGEYIKSNRLRQGLTQTQLCEGICEPFTLSRLENNRQVPNRAHITALLQRLGLPSDQYYAIMTANEEQMEFLKKEINSCTVTGKYREGLEKVEALEALTDPDDNLTRQFLLRSRVILGHITSGELCPYPLDEQIRMLMQAIHLTIPDFAIDRMDRYLYTYDEVKIIENLATRYFDSGQRQKALPVFEQLLDYVQKHFPNIAESGGLIPFVAFNYARCLDADGQYGKSLQIAKIGRQACVNYGQYRTLPGTLSIMAECCHFLGQEDRSRHLYLQAYYLAESIDYPHVADTARREMKEYLGVEPEG